MTGNDNDMIWHDILLPPSHPFASQSIMGQAIQVRQAIYIERDICRLTKFFLYLKSRQIQCKAYQAIHPLLWFERHVVIYLFWFCAFNFAKWYLLRYLRSSWGDLLISQKEAYLYPFQLSPFLSLLIGMVSRVTPMMDGRRLIRHNHTKDKGR